MIIVPLFAGCVATDKDMANVSLRVRTVDSKVLDIDKEIAVLKEETFEQVRILQAKESARIDELQSEILILRGHIEELNRINRGLRNDLAGSANGLREDIDALGLQIAEKLSVLEERVAQQEKNSSTMATDIALLQDRAAQADTGIAEIKRARALEAVERARQAAAAVAEAKSIKKLAEGDIVIKPVIRKSFPGQDQNADMPPAAAPSGTLYEEGIRAYNDKKYTEAIGLFGAYIREHPKGKFLADAYFMRGETYYSQREYESAILEYQTVIEDYFDHSKAAAALLKQGLSFEKINDTNAAGILYRQIIDNYPDSEQVIAARKRLESIE